MRKTARLRRALVALHSDGLPYILDAVAAISEKQGHGRYARVFGLLSTIKDGYVDALCVLMYEGRDEYIKWYPYTRDKIDDEFINEWDHLNMDNEHYVRIVMAEKTPLSHYLRRGAYMYRLTDDLPEQPTIKKEGNDGE